MLKAITLWEPWASLMAIGAKTNETRGQRTNHRGDIAIHAAIADHGVPETIIQATLHAFQSRGIVPTPASMGCIVAVVDLFDCVPSEDFAGEDSLPVQGWGRIKLSAEDHIFGNYSLGRFVYRTRNLRRLKQPVRCRGAQSIGWTVPPDVEALVRAQL